MRPLGLLLLLLAPSAYAQTEADLVDAARAFPPMPREAADLLGTFIPPSAFTFASGTPYNDLEYTLFDTSYIEGETNGFDTFMPVDPSEPTPGADTVVLVRGVNNLDLEAAYSGPVGDRIILGTAQTVFFRRGSNGLDDDYAVVQNVDYNAPMLHLHGIPEDYRLRYYTSADGVQTEGHYLFHTGGAAPDLIAFVWPCDVLGSTVSGNPPRDEQVLCNASKRLTLEPGVHVRYAEPFPEAAEVPDAFAQIGTAGKEIVGGVAMDARGNAYLLGSSDGSLGGTLTAENTAFVAQLRPDGSRGWTFELPVSNGTLLFDAAADAEHLYVAGRTLGALPGFQNEGRWDAVLLQLDLDTGDLVAADQYGTPGLDGYGNVTLDGMGGIYVSGAGSALGEPGTDPDYLVAKYETDTLARVWQIVEAPEANGPVFVSEAWGGLSVAPASDGRPARLLAGGWYMSRGGAAGFLSLYEGIETDTPQRVASASIDSPGTETDWVLDNTIGPDGALYAAGYTTGSVAGTPRGDGDGYVVRFDADLTNPVFVRLGTPQHDVFRKLEQEPDGTLYAVGTTYGDAAAPNADPWRQTGDAWAVRLGPDLSILEETQFGTRGEDRGFAALTADALLVGGSTEAALAAPTAGTFDAFAAALSPTDLSFLRAIPVATSTPPRSALDLRVQPNPSTGPASVRLTLPASGTATVTVADALGRNVAVLHDGPLGAGIHTLPVRLALAPGLYLVHAATASGVQTQTFTLVR
ncbi:MAG: T9SS type A sorting domain-containing protein [Bacteroidota bacterium]